MDKSKIIHQLNQYYNHLIDNPYIEGIHIFFSDKREKGVVYEFGNDMLGIFPTKHKEKYKLSTFYKNFIKGDECYIFFCDNQPITDYNAYDIRILNNSDKDIFDEFLSKCSKDDKAQGQVSLDDPYVIGAFIDDKLAGVLSLWKWGKTLHDIGILVNPDARKKGIGKALIAYAKNNNDFLLVYRCDTDNKQSYALAESCGFKRYGLVYNAIERK